MFHATTDPFDSISEKPFRQKKSAASVIIVLYTTSASGFSILLAFRTQPTFGDPGTGRAAPETKSQKKSLFDVSQPVPADAFCRETSLIRVFSLRGATRVLFHAAQGSFLSISSFRPSI